LFFLISSEPQSLHETTGFFNSLLGNKRPIFCALGEAANEIGVP
jgi:hypothetical protein